MSRPAHDFEALTQDLRRMAGLAVHQLERALSCFHALDLDRAEEVIERDDALDNFNVSLEGRCHALLSSGRFSGPEARIVRATSKVAANLERAGDAGTHIAKRVRIVSRERAEPVEFAFPDVEAIALTAVTEATQSFLERGHRGGHRGLRGRWTGGHIGAQDAHPQPPPGQLVGSSGEG
jgi:phosphate transport system protein